MNAHLTRRHRLFQILELQSHKDQSAAMVFSWVLTLMVLANVLAVILESVPAIESQYGPYLAVFDLFSVAFFSVEYLLRIWTAAERNPQTHAHVHRRRLAYVLSFHGVIDFWPSCPFSCRPCCPAWTCAFCV